MKKQKELISINNYCNHSHNINKGKFVYSSKMYTGIIRSLNDDFLPAENSDYKIYEKYLDF